jgi:ankyrin repeat protein
MILSHLRFPANQICQTLLLLYFSKENRFSHYFWRYPPVHKFIILIYFKQTMEDLIFEVQHENPFIEACYNGDLATAKEFLNQGVDIDAVAESGSAALHIAAQNGDVDLVNFLIQKEADVNLTTDDGLTALHFAALRGYLEITNSLIKARIDVNIAGRRYNRTALHYAADKNQSDVAKALVEAGANPDLLDILGFSPLKIASSKNNLDVANAILTSKS